MVAESIAAAAFWLVMAFQNRAARGDGPRILSVVLFCGGTSQTWQYFHELNSGATLSVTVVIWFVGLAASGLSTMLVLQMAGRLPVRSWEQTGLS